MRLLLMSAQAAKTCLQACAHILLSATFGREGAVKELEKISYIKVTIVYLGEEYSIEYDKNKSLERRSN